MRTLREQEMSSKQLRRKSKKVLNKVLEPSEYKKRYNVEKQGKKLIPSSLASWRPIEQRQSVKRQIKRL